MLVITRRSSERILFPQLGITIQFIRVQGRSAKVGIDAPRDITIVRDEVSDNTNPIGRIQEQCACLPQEVLHDIRNELHAISLGTYLFKEQMKVGAEAEAVETFAEIQAAICRLDENEVLNRPADRKSASLPGAVLIVEDDENEREMLAGFLRLQGFPVVALRDGAEALEYLSTHDEPSVVLVDMNMPKCDGGEMVRTLRSDGRHDETRVFAISGSTPEENDLQIGEGGVDRWFRKPLNPQFLLDAI